MKCQALPAMLVGCRLFRADHDSYNEHFLPAAVRLNPIQRYGLTVMVDSTKLSQRRSDHRQNLKSYTVWHYRDFPQCLRRNIRTCMELTALWRADFAPRLSHVRFVVNSDTEKSPHLPRVLHFFSSCGVVKKNTASSSAAGSDWVTTLSDGCMVKA